MSSTPNYQSPTPKQRASGEMAKEKPYDIRERTFLFSLQVLKWIRTLPKDWATQVIAKQSLRAATSVGANVEEADGTETAKDKIYKWAVPRKAAREARYWIRLLIRDGADSTEARTLHKESSELVNILSAMIKKGKKDL